jgi:5-methylcytosine-specific restriction endonuclease McrA
MNATAKARETARKRAIRKAWRQANPGLKAAEDRAYRARVASRPEVVAEREKTLTKRIASQLARRAAHDAARLRREEWSEGKRDRQLAHWRHKQRTRRAIMRGAGGAVGPRQLQALYDLQGGCCAYCGEPAEHLDHKTPISREGRHEGPNLHWLCAFHNMAKASKTDAEYRALAGIPAHTPWDVSTALYRLALLS